MADAALTLALLREIRDKVDALDDKVDALDDKVDALDGKVDALETTVSRKLDLQADYSRGLLRHLMMLASRSVMASGAAGRRRP